jgi:hypothetical protein
MSTGAVDRRAFCTRLGAAACCAARLWPAAERFPHHGLAQAGETWLHTIKVLPAQ